ncbi:MAG TPA: hypothetical protein VNK46_07145 [Nitrospiraceae bacterium]|jgi:hypothetical protein|nr:hypothetical protein [Nitrospiraceae bacterium]
MVEIIGLATMCALIWVLAATLAGESDAEHRRPVASTGRSLAEEESDEKTRRAA